jgi:hypothetical protein
MLAVTRAVAGAQGEDALHAVEKFGEMSGWWRPG